MAMVIVVFFWTYRRPQRGGLLSCNAKCADTRAASWAAVAGSVGSSDAEATPASGSGDAEVSLDIA